MFSIKKIYNTTPKEIKYILFYFIVTRIVLEFIGVSTIQIWGDKARFPSYPADYTNFLWLNIWGHWDTGWYTSIARDWYTNIQIGSVGQQTYAFFPLYPLLIKLLGFFIKNLYISGLIISNVSLFIAAYFLYQLEKMDNGVDSAKRAIKYLFLFPLGFLFSSVLTESTFIALAISSFYFAKRDKWWLAGILGFFAALTRSVGLFLIIPLAIEYISNKKWQINKIRFDLLAVLFVPLGTIVYVIYNYYLTGDFLAFAHAQSAWGKEFNNPLHSLYSSLRGDIYTQFCALSAILGFGAIIIFYKKLTLTEWLICFYSIIFPLFTGTVSMPRYLLAAFPLFLLFARIGKHRIANQAMNISFCLLQGFLMVFWVLGTWLVM